MKFVRLQDDLLSILFEDDDIIAIDKPYGFNAHTNDSKIEHSEFIQDGLIEIYEKQLSRKLHIIHRLDQTTTGVMIFGKSVESAKKYAEYFFNRQVKKTYVFITQKKSQQDFFLIDQVIVHKAKELDAKTELRVLQRSGRFELWQANPLTGRNHQIRIHAQAAGLSILGDEKYDGARFPFLCLHNRRIEFPNGLVITAEPPSYFEDLQLLDDAVLAQCLLQIDRRQRLFGKNLKAQTLRLIHHKNNAQIPGFTLDQMGDRLILNWYFEHWTSVEEIRFTKLALLLKKLIIVRWLGSKATAQKVILLGAENHSTKTDTNWVTHEFNRSYAVQIENSTLMGPTTNQRLQRQWIFRNAKQKAILNIFCQSGTASVAAALGEAQQVTSVDLGKANLNLSRKNFELNQLDPSSFLFYCRDSITFLQQASAKKLQYDLILCEVPSFLRREKGFFKIENDLQQFLMNALACLTEHGQMLLSTNYDGFYIDSVRQIIGKAIVESKIKADISCVLPSLDFELPDEKANLKSFIIQKLES